jgi:hypothetical protein
LTTVNSRKQLLSAKKLKINHIVYDVTEFLAPINVLICSKCCGIGHFRKQCPDQLETCRTCSQQFHEGSQHVCSNQTRCKHCNGDHSSNSNKCPVIESFRSTLTRLMLTRNGPTNRYPATDTRPNISFRLNQRHNISPPNMWDPSIMTLSSKLDEVMKSVNSLKESVNVINESNKK